MFKYRLTSITLIYGLPWETMQQILVPKFYEYEFTTLISSATSHPSKL